MSPQEVRWHCPHVCSWHATFLVIKRADLQPCIDLSVFLSSFFDMLFTIVFTLHPPSLVISSRALVQATKPRGERGEQVDTLVTQAQTLVITINEETEENIQKLLSDMMKAHVTHMNKLEACSKKFNEKMTRLASYFIERVKVVEEMEKNWRKGTHHKILHHNRIIISTYSRKKSSRKCESPREQCYTQSQRHTLSSAQGDPPPLPQHLLQCPFWWQ